MEELSDFPGILARQLSPSGWNIFDAVLDPRDWLMERRELIISSNPALQHFSVPLGWRGGTYVTIEGNAQLRELDFSDLESIDLLEINDNATLTQVSLGALATVDSLEVTDNPMLPAAAFDAVRTFERTMSGNAGTAP